MKTTPPPDILSMMGRDELKLDDTYHCSGWERINERILIVRMAKKKTLTRGPRKGSSVYFGKEVQTGVTMAEIDAYRASWEAETGLCSNCGGDGIANIGWHHETGAKHGHCKRCNQTGKKP